MASGRETLESMQEFLLGGTWITTTEDGQTVTHTYSTRETGKFLRNEMKGGPLPGIGILGLDPTTGKCTWWSFLDDGNTANFVIEMDDDGVWHMESTDQSAPIQYKGRIKRLDANTIQEEGFKMAIAGKAQPNGVFTWKRQTDDQMPLTIRKQIESSVIGEWKYEGHWGDKKFGGEESVRWGADKTAVIREGHELNDGKRTNYTMLLGWDSETKTLKYRGFSSKGESWSGEWSDLESQEWNGMGQGVYEGIKWKSKTSVRFGKDTIRYQDTTDGKKWVAEFWRK